MRKMLLLLVLCFLCATAFSQYTIDSSGVLAPEKTRNVNTTIVSTLLVRDNEVPRKAVFKELLKRVEQTLSNLEDDSLRLREQYGAFYCGNFFCTFYEDMKKVRDSLKSNVLDTSSPYFPGAQIRRWLDTARLYEVKNTAGSKEYKVYINKVFNDLICNLYRDTAYSGIRNWEMDMQYKKAWRQMELYYRQGNRWLDSLSKANGTIILNGNCDIPYVDVFIRNMKALMRDSCYNPAPDTPYCNIYTDEVQKIIPLMYHIKDPQGIKKWLWFSGGIVTMNPLLVTTPNRRYPATEKWTILDSPSVNTARKADTDSAYKDLFTTKKLWNDIRLPARPNNTLHKYITEYYDNDPASYHKGKFPYLLTHRDSVNVWVYNVAAADKLNITREFKAIPDAAAATTQLNNALDAFPTAIIGTTIGANLGGILNNINSQNRQVTPLPVPSGNQSTFSAMTGNRIRAGKFTSRDDMRATNVFDSVQFSTLLYNNYQVYTYNRNRNTVEQDNEGEEEDLDFLIIKERKIIFKKEQDYNLDKRNIIIATLSFIDPNCGFCKDTTKRYIIDSFVAKDYCVTLDYSPKKLLPAIDSMMQRFFKFKACVNDCLAAINSKIDDLTVIQKYLSKYMVIANRSLPPDISGFKPFKDEQPSFSTAIFQNGLEDSSAQHIISIKKTAKINDRDSITTLKKLKFKTGKIHYIDASAGLALTITDYTVPEAQASGLPTTKSGDKVQLNAGIHIYPFGYIKVDNRLIPFSPCNAIHRLSAYLGVSIGSKPLNNLYTGIGYDIVPGIKAITGVHWFKNTRYQVVNNQVFNQADGYEPTWFFAINIEPMTLTKALGIIK